MWGRMTAGRRGPLPVGTRAEGAHSTHHGYNISGWGIQERLTSGCSRIAAISWTWRCRDMQVQGRLWLAKIHGASEQLASALPQLQAATSRAIDP